MNARIPLVLSLVAGCLALSEAGGAELSAPVPRRRPLRGVMLPKVPHERDFADLKAMGVTLVRYQMHGDRRVAHDELSQEEELADFDKWLEARLDHLEKNVVPWARRCGMRVCVDLHDSPGGRVQGGDVRMYYNPVYAERYVEAWRQIARRMKRHADVVYGYDLFNEPVQNKEAAVGCDWFGLQLRAAEAVRAIDPGVTIVAEAGHWSGVDSYRTMKPIPLENVVYEVHVYDPGQFTHQRVSPDRDYTTTYPGTSPDGKETWDKDYLRKKLEPVRRFQQQHGVRIYVGEFSAVCWAEGADVWLADVISLFEEYGWDWTYHAFREWQGWSFEFEGTPDKNFTPSADNPRKRVLLQAFRRR